MFSNILRSVSEFITGDNLRTALRKTVGAVIPLLVLKELGYEALGLELMLGTILVSGADLPESFREKLKSIVSAAILSGFFTLVVCLVAQQYWVLLPVLFVSIFVLAFVAPFEERYNGIAFAGFLAIIIALSTYKLYEDIPAIFRHSGRLMAGSAWYLVYTLTIFWLTAKQQLVQQVVKCMKQTAAYLDKRVSLFSPDIPLHDGMLALTHLQSELILTHNQLREFLLKETAQLNVSGSHQRRMFLVFAELVEMLEAALATPLDYQKWHVWLRQHPDFAIIPRISQLLVKELEYLAGTLTGLKGTNHYQKPIRDALDSLKSLLESYAPSATAEADHEQMYYHAKRVQLYQELQFRKLQSIASILQGETDEAEVALDKNAYHRFANARQITRNSIRSNLTFQSSFFRYALRTAVTAILGYTLGKSLGLENADWILLTVLVVMKPGYAVTRQRFIHRVVGTIVGATIAYGLYLLEPSHNLSLLIFAIALFFAFSFLPVIYAVATTFFTIYVVFLYSFLHREIPVMVIYRVTDTALGATLCFLAIHYLWPSWEHRSFPYYLRQSLEANRALFFRIMKQVYQQDLQLTEYRLARKQAYVTMANLVSSYQRYNTEPKKKKRMSEEYGNILLMNYTILSIISTLGVYIRRHPSLLRDLSVLKEKFFEINDHLETLSDELYHRQGAHLPAEGAERKETEAWSQTRKKWMDFQESGPPVAPVDVAFIREQLLNLDDLLQRLKDQVQKLAPAQKISATASDFSSATRFGNLF